MVIYILNYVIFPYDGVLFLRGFPQRGADKYIF